MKECELCDLEKKTKWYYEDSEFVVCDCETCKIPMIVSKDHNFRLKDFPGHGADRIFKIVQKVFPGRDFYFRTEQRKVKNHWHWHIIFEE